MDTEHANQGATMSDLDENVNSALDAARELVRDLGKLGAGWVRYALSVGESSVQTTAHSLDEAARALGKLADRLRNSSNL
ncbi:MAG: hypothetical protein ACXVDD_15800 [Polyangia bacterium]